MYRVVAENNGTEYMLHDVHSQEEQIYDDELSEEMGKTATFRFTVPRDHPNLNQIKPLSTEIRVYKDGDPIFWGRVVNPSADIYNTQTVTCVGGLSYLADSIQAPFDITGTGTAFLERLLETHNSQVEERKKLYLGNVDVAIRETERILESYTDTLTVLNSLLVNVYGGYLRVRQQGGIRYLDYLTNYGGINTQTVRFGENILDLTSEIDASEIITVLIPQGAETDGGRVGISSVNNGKDYIEDDAAIGRWGRIWGYALFGEITDPQELLEAARDYLQEKTTFPRTINVTAIDLSLMDPDVEDLKLGYWTNFVSKPHDLTATYLLQKLTRHITAPQNDTVVFGIVQETLSGVTADTAQVVTQSIEQAKESINKTMEEKIQNATKLITGGTGGYFVIGLNDAGQPNETFWMDAPNTAQAVHVIRINRNGIGFSTSGMNGPYTNAWTIDGNLLADFITAGTMLCDRIRGGTLEVGGTGTAKNGVILVKDNAGNTIVQIDKNGIKILKGSIDLGNGAFKVTEGGRMDLAGTNNSSTIGCNVFSANSANIGALEVNSDSQFLGLMTAMDIQCDEIACTQIYSSRAGEWWSDRRLKEDIVSIPAKICQRIVCRLKPVRFKFREDGTESIGFIAQDVQEILEEEGINLPLVGRFGGYLSIPYAVYVSLLAGALQAQDKEIGELRKVIGYGRHK